jgi:hypothetical protein
MFVFVVSAFNSKASRATLIGVLLFFVGYFLTLVASYETGSKQTIRSVSIHPITAMSYGIQVIGSLEDAGVGITRTTLNSTDNPSGLTFVDILSSLFF